MTAALHTIAASSLLAAKAGAGNPPPAPATNPAFVAQRKEQRLPMPHVAGSNPAERATRIFDGWTTRRDFRW